MASKWWLALAAVAVVSGCNRGKDDDDRPQTRQQTARRDSVVRKPVYPEQEAAQILRVINDAEIATARIARERSQNDDILRYASVMIADHRAMTALLDSIVPPVPDTINPESRALREAATQLVDSLWRIEGGFNNTYIENQVRAHERALLLLDTALIPSARTPELKRLLQDLRPAVVAHLQRARQVWSARMANPELRAQAPRARTAPTTSTPPATTPAAAPQPQPQPQPQPTPPPAPPDTAPPPTTTTGQ